MFDSIPELQRFPHLRHVISNRLGGVSAGGFGTLNLGYHVGDAPAHVSENRRRLARAVGYDPAALVAAQQVHGTEIALVDASDRGRGAFSWDSAIPDTDGLIVSAPGVPVAIQVADCAPVLIADPVHHTLAVVHAGWRGALGGITSKAITRMIACAGSDPTDLYVGIGPTLCPSCLEVGNEVAVAVEAVFGASVLVRGTRKPHLDIRGMITADVGGVGVPVDHILTHPDCTRCTVERFFSHRGQQGHAGRFALIAWFDE